MPLSPRRSTRGAAPAAPTSTTSSSLSSSRQDRNARATNNQTSATPRSISSDEIEPVRRSQRAHQKDDSPVADTEAIEDPDEEAIDEEEITRCICGYQEYPGPPLSEAFSDVHDALSDDAGGLFILCDGCSVWQHGGCVGIVEESQSPDKYFCEQCRPKMHAIQTDSRGYVCARLNPSLSRTRSTRRCCRMEGHVVLAAAMRVDRQAPRPRFLTVY